MDTIRLNLLHRHVGSELGPPSFPSADDAYRSNLQKVQEECR
jgi:hypothetical protein